MGSQAFLTFFWHGFRGLHGCFCLEEKRSKIKGQRWKVKDYSSKVKGERSRVKELRSKLKAQR